MVGRRCHGYLVLEPETRSGVSTSEGQVDLMCMLLANNLTLFDLCVMLQNRSMSSSQYQNRTHSLFAPPAERDTCSEYKRDAQVSFAHFDKHWAQVFALSFICLFGMLLNGLVLLVSLSPSIWKSKATVLVASLASADLLHMVVNCPANLYLLMNYGWGLGELCCRLKHFLQISFLTVTLGSLTVLSHDRCCAITDPINTFSVTSSVNSGFVALAVWVISFLLGIPDLIWSKVTKAIDTFGNHVQVCELTSRFVFCIPLFEYIIALVSISYCYCRLALHLSPNSANQIIVGNPIQRRAIQSRRFRVAKLVLFLVVLFFVCVTPATIYDLYLTFMPENYKTSIRWICTDLMFAHSIVNPLALFALSAAYREALRNTWRLVTKFNWRKIKLRFIDRRSSNEFEMVKFIGMRKPPTAAKKVPTTQNKLQNRNVLVNNKKVDEIKEPVPAGDAEINDGEIAVGKCERDKKQRRKERRFSDGQINTADRNKSDSSKTKTTF